METIMHIWQGFLLQSVSRSKVGVKVVQWRTTMGTFRWGGVPTCISTIKLVRDRA